MEIFGSDTQLKYTRRSAIQGFALLAAGGLLATRFTKLALAHDSKSTPIAGDYPTIAYTAKEYAFDGPVETTSGYTNVTLHNQGTMEHHAMFLKLNDGKTVSDLAAAATSQGLAGLFSVSTSVGGPGSIDAGHSTSVVVNFEPGSYVLVCVIPGDDGVPHMAKGMALPIEVKAAASGVIAAEEPKADTEVKLTEYMFADLPDTVNAGKQVWKVENTGAQLHELAIYRLAAGVTFEQVQALLNGGAAATPESMPGMDMSTPDQSAATPDPNAAPWTAVTGIAPISPHQVNWLEYDFKSGDYVAICYVPDISNGAPHFALGMIMPFSVK